jgi:uncharacterized protein YacL
LAVAFDWFPKLAPWYDTLSELKKKELMAALLFLTVGIVYGGICTNLFLSTSFSCTQASLADLVKVATLAIMANQAVHALTKPTQAYKFSHFAKGPNGLR